MTLDQLAHGSAATIRGVGGAGSFRRRLLELGMVPGTTIERSGQAPLGDPLTFRLRGSVLSLRRVDAEQVEVEVS